MKDVTKVPTELPPSLEDFDAIARAAWAEIPGEIRHLAGDVVFRIEDFADEQTLASLGIEDPFELTGLYHGVDLTQRDHMGSSVGSGDLGPMVFLYRRAILDEWIDRGDVPLADLIAHVLVHEIGHHFGLSDEAMDAILDAED